jgi:hypothetical protein
LNAQLTIINLIRKIVQWDKENQKLEVSEHQFISEIVQGKKELTDVNKKIVVEYLNKVKKYGFGQ